MRKKYLAPDPQWYGSTQISLELSELKYFYTSCIIMLMWMLRGYSYHLHYTDNGAALDHSH